MKIQPLTESEISRLNEILVKKNMDHGRLVDIVEALCEMNDIAKSILATTQSILHYKDGEDCVPSLLLLLNILHPLVYGADDYLIE